MSDKREDIREAMAVIDRLGEARSAVEEIDGNSRELSLVRTKIDEARMWMTEHMRLCGLLVVLLVAGCCGDNEPAPDATPVDALELDACICRPEWPGCPPGCSPPADAGVSR